jgi:hypothetical protein
MTKILSAFAFLACTFISCIHQPLSKGTNTGMPGPCTVRGKIVDYEGLPVAGATIQLEGSSLCGIRTAKTDLGGYYYLTQLPAGSDYKMIIEADGFDRIARPNIKLLPWFTMNLTFALSSGRGCFFGWSALPMIDHSDLGGTTVIESASPTSIEKEK